MSWEIIARILVVLSIMAEIYNYIFFVYIILGYFSIDENNILVKAIKGVCEPLYFALLRILPPFRLGMLDFSPLYMFIFIIIVQNILKYLAVIVSRL